MINIRYYVSSSPYVNTSAYILAYDSNYLYIADNIGISVADGRIFKIYVGLIRNDLYPRTLVEYDESDNITWENCRVTDSNLVDSLIDIQPACWQQYIDRDGKNFKVYAFPLK